MTGELEQSLRNWINSVFKENGMNDSTIPRETSLSNALKDGTSLCRLATALRSSLNDTNHASNRGKRIRYNVNPRGIARLERENLSIFFQTITRDLIISAKECPVTVDDILTGEDEKLITLLQFIRCKTNEKQESNHSNNNNNNNENNNENKNASFKKHQISKTIQTINTDIVMDQDLLNGLREENTDLKQRLKQFLEKTSSLQDITQDIEALKEMYQDIEHGIEVLGRKIEFVMDTSRSRDEQGRAFLIPEEDGAPEGRVTLVFTDVQSSTALWEWNPKLMASSLKLHNAVIRECLSEWNGYEVKTEGDAFMCAFSDALDAVNFAVDCQLRLLNADWDEEVFAFESAAIETVKENTIWRGLRVRMGIHCGEPMQERDPTTKRMDYFGPMVNLSARCEGQAKGGQVLFSGSVWNEIEDRTDQLYAEPEIDHDFPGPTHVKGIHEPVYLRQILPGQLSGRNFKPPPSTTSDSTADSSSSSVSSTAESSSGSSNELNIDQLKSNLANLESQRDQIKAALSQLEAKLQALCGELAELMEDQELIPLLQSESNTLQSTFHEASQTVSNLEEGLAKFEQHLRRVTSTQQENNDGNATSTEKEEDYDKIDYNETTRSVSSLNKMLAQLRQELLRAIENESKAKERLESVESSLQEKEETMKTQRSEMEQLKESLRIAEQKIEELKQEKEQQQSKFEHELQQYKEGQNHQQKDSSHSNRKIPEFHSNSQNVDEQVKELLNEMPQIRDALNVSRVFNSLYRINGIKYNILNQGGKLFAMDKQVMVPIEELLERHMNR